MDFLALLTWDGSEWVVSYIHPTVAGILTPVAAVASLIWGLLVILAFSRGSSWVPGLRNRRRP